MSESSPSETFTVSISVSNTVNVPASIPGDYGSAIIPSVYDEEYFSMDLTFSVTSSISGSVPVSNVVFSFTPNVEGLSINKVSNSVIRVSGTPTNVFNQTYTFLKNDFAVSNTERDGRYNDKLSARARERRLLSESIESHAIRST